MGDRKLEAGHVVELDAIEHADPIVAGAAAESHAPVQSLLDSSAGGG
jgi:hypothetical protein